ncbi:MAG: hypothetical protein WCR52_20250, partial [Bacteroidota bacterium]
PLRTRQIINYAIPYFHATFSFQTRYSSGNQTNKASDDIFFQNPVFHAIYAIFLPLCVFY